MTKAELAARVADLEVALAEEKRAKSKIAERIRKQYLDPALAEHSRLARLLEQAEQRLAKAFEPDGRRCRDCRYWKDDAFPPRGLGQCTRALHESDAWVRRTGSDGQAIEVLKPKAARVTAFTQDISDFATWLHTLPEHGCTMFERTARRGKDNG